MDISQKILERFKSLRDPDGFSEFGLGDRHGSLERTWSWSAESPPLTRFVIISATPSANCYELEISIGADNDRSYVRRLFARLPAVDRRSLCSAEWQERVEDELNRAAQAASEIEWHDLTSTRPVALDQGMASTQP